MTDDVDSGAAVVAAPDDVMGALDELLSVARENIVAWIGVMERVEGIREQHRAGVRFSDMQVASGGRPIIDVVARNQERLTRSAAQFRRALARTLAAEGMSHADIARIFGVSRQRVANLMRSGESD